MDQDTKDSIRFAAEAICKIESHLSRLASAAESPFWRLMQCPGVASLYREGDGWVAALTGHLEGRGPTPQAAVEAFDAAFKKGTP